MEEWKTLKFPTKHIFHFKKENAIKVRMGYQMLPKIYLLL